MLPRNQRMELLLKAYVRAIAAQAGCTCEELESDYGLDLAIRGVQVEGQQYFDRGALVEIQIKSTLSANVRLTDESIHYDLAVRNYNHLRTSSPRSIPRFLVLFLMPDDEAEWLAQSANGLTLRQCCYYQSLQGAPETTNVQSVRVAIPRTHVFSVRSLQEFAEKAK